jgi:hypothetical protein
VQHFGLVSVTFFEKLIRWFEPCRAESSGNYF